MSPESQALTILGLFLNLIGVLILFRYGMPYRVRTGGAVYIVMEKKNEVDEKEERRYDFFGWIGIALVVIGTGLQMFATAHP